MFGVALGWINNTGHGKKRKSHSPCCPASRRVWLKTSHCVGIELLRTGLDWTRSVEQLGNDKSRKNNAWTEKPLAVIQAHGGRWRLKRGYKEECELSSLSNSYFWSFTTPIEQESTKIPEKNTGRKKGDKKIRSVTILKILSSTLVPKSKVSPAFIHYNRQKNLLSDCLNTMLLNCHW